MTVAPRACLTHPSKPISKPSWLCFAVVRRRLDEAAMPCGKRKQHLRRILNLDGPHRQRHDEMQLRSMVSGFASVQTSNRTARFGHHHDRLTSRPSAHPEGVLPTATSHLSTIVESHGHVRHCRQNIHEDGLLPFSPGLHHKDKATQSV